MKITALIVSIVPALMVTACDEGGAELEGGASVEGDVAERVAPVPGAKEADNYYRLRRDFRRCIYPLCGGYWVSAVNRPQTVCADGHRAAECYIADLSLPEGVELGDDDLVHGSLGVRTYEGFEQAFGALEADYLYAPVLDPAESFGSAHLVFDTGIRCITTPCPSVATQPLNRHRQSRPRDIFMFGPDDAADQLLEESFAAEFAYSGEAGQGAITFGLNWWGVHFVTNVYALKQVEAVCLVDNRANGNTAWNFPSAEAAMPLAAALEAPELLPGHCDAQQLACTQEYAPVHGTIDALGDACVEYANPCLWRAAVIHGAGAEGKAKGDWQPGNCPPFEGCLVVYEGNNVTAWNVSSREQAESLLGPGGYDDFVLHETNCEETPDAIDRCPFAWAPVCGSLETAAGTTVATYDNACEFGVSVEHAAGATERARGDYALGECDDE